MTRSDIAFVISVVIQFISTPMVKHWEVLEQILRYLKEGPGLDILYRNHVHTRVECFSDVDWAG